MSSMFVLLFSMIYNISDFYSSNNACNHQKVPVKERELISTGFHDHLIGNDGKSLPDNVLRVV